MHISSQSNEPVGYDSENFSESSTTGSDNSELSTKELSAERRGVGERLTEIIEDTRTTLKMFYTGTERNIRQNGPENFLSYPEAFGFSTRLDGSVAKYLIKKGFLYEVVEHKDRFIDLALDKDTALNFIKERKGVSSVLENREMFPDLTQQEIIDSAVENGHGVALVYALDHLDLEDKDFKGLDKSLALKYIEETGHVFEILKNKEVFPDLTQQEIIECAEKHGQGRDLVYDLDLLDLEDKDFKGLDKSLALEYIEEIGDVFKILKNKKAFPDLTQQEIIECAEKHGHGLELVRSLHYLDLEDNDFKGFDKSLALEFIKERGYVSQILKYKEVFPDLTQQEIIDSAVENGHGVALVYALDHLDLEDKDFKGLDKSLALKYIEETGHVFEILKNKEVFPDLTQQEIIKCAEKHGHGASLVYTLDFLVEGVDNYEIREVYVLDLLDLEDEEFEGLDKSLALEFIKEKGDVPYILKYQEVFRGLSQQEIIECAEKHGHGVALVCALEEDLLDLEDEEFEGLDENLALIYLEGPAPDFGMILRKIEVFPDLTQQEIIDSAVDSGHGVELVHALDFLDLEDGDFKGLDKSLALKYIEETRSVSHILENKEVFPDLTVQEVMEYAEKNGISVEK